MANSLFSRLSNLKTPARLPARLKALDLALLKKTRASVLAANPAPAVLAAAKTQAKALADAAKEKAAQNRTAAVKKAMASQKAAMSEAKQRVLANLKLTADRPPSVILASLLARLDSEKRKLDRHQTASLLIRSNQLNLAGFEGQLAKALGLPASADLKRKRIQAKQVLAHGNGESATYSVRLPIKRSSVAMEIHNIAWALRKSDQFLSVKADGNAKGVFSTAVTHALRAERAYDWHLALTHALEAHRLEPRPAGKKLGEGIVIGHLDTGWSPHPQYNESQIDTERAIRISTGQTGRGPSRHSALLKDAGLMNLTHGTATGSVILGGTSGEDAISLLPESKLAFKTDDEGNREYGDPNRAIQDSQGKLTGIAPKAKVLPIKFIDDVVADIDHTGLNGAGVVRIADEDLVEALQYAGSRNCHVVSLSIGGLMDQSVRDAIDTLVEGKNIIVVAAAGQIYKLGAFNQLSQMAAGLGIPVGDTVVLPAAYANVIAVAGCSPDGRPWDESMRGPNVDITAPADAVWVAEFDGKKAKADGTRLPVVEAASGTSFAAAFMAGVAALWLSHWGRDFLLEKYQGKPLAWVFRHQLQETADSGQSKDWDKRNYGPGIVNVRKLLEQPLPHPRLVSAPPATEANLFTVLSGSLDSPAAQIIESGWGVLYNVGSELGHQFTHAQEAAWAAGASVANALLGMGEDILTDLFAASKVAGAISDQAANKAAIDAAAGFMEAAAEYGEEVARAAAEAGNDAVEAVESVAEAAANAVGEAAEDVLDFLFG